MIQLALLLTVPAFPIFPAFLSFICLLPSFLYLLPFNYMKYKNADVSWQKPLNEQKLKHTTGNYGSDETSSSRNYQIVTGSTPVLPMAIFSSMKVN
jgi:hypothetical protein